VGSGLGEIGCLSAVWWQDLVVMADGYSNLTGYLPEKSPLRRLMGDLFQIYSSCDEHF